MPNGDKEFPEQLLVPATPEEIARRTPTPRPMNAKEWLYQSRQQERPWWLGEGIARDVALSQVTSIAFPMFTSLLELIEESIPEKGKEHIPAHKRVAERIVRRMVPQAFKYETEESLKDKMAKLGLSDKESQWLRTGMTISAMGLTMATAAPAAIAGLTKLGKGGIEMGKGFLETAGRAVELADLTTLRQLARESKALTTSIERALARGIVPKGIEITPSILKRGTAYIPFGRNRRLNIKARLANEIERTYKGLKPSSLWTPEEIAEMKRLRPRLINPKAPSAEFIFEELKGAKVFPEYMQFEEFKGMLMSRRGLSKPVGKYVTMAKDDPAELLLRFQEVTEGKAPGTYAKVLPEPRPVVTELTPYKKEILAEVEKLPELPKMESGVLEWQPPGIGYKNPYTQFQYKLWNRMTKWWDAKMPRMFKTFQSREVAELAKEKQRILDGLTRQMSDDIVKTLKRLPLAERQQVGLMINKYIPVDPKFKPLVKEIDVRIGQLTKNWIDLDKQLVASGEMAADLATLSEETALRHLGEYARHFYFRPSKIPGKPPVVKPGQAPTKGVIQRGMFKRRMTPEEWGERTLSFQGKSVEEIARTPTAELRKIGIDAKINYGWVHEADLMYEKTMRDMINNYATRQWQVSVVRNPQLYSKAPKEGFIPVKDLLPRGTTRELRLGPINDGFINPVMEDEIKLMVRFGQDLPNVALGETLSWWKALKVAGNPATVARNYISGGFIQTDLAGYSPLVPRNAQTYLSSVANYATRGSRYKFWKNKGLYGADYYSVEISPEMMKATREAANPYQEFGAQLAMQRGMALKISQTMRRPLRYYGAIDHIQRTYLAEAAFKDGASASQAVHFANKWELDYRFVPKLLEQMRSGIPGFFFPFVSFPGLMAPRIAEVLVTRPWVLAKYPFLVQALGLYGAARLGMSAEDVKAAQPRFLKDSPYSVVMPWRDKQGNPQFLNLDYTLPFGSYDTAFFDWAAIFDMAKGGGLAGVVQNVLTNYDSWSGRKIYDENEPPKAQNDKIYSYLFRALGPGALTHGINIYKAAKGEVIGWPYRRPRDITQTSLRAIGISTYSGGQNEMILKIFKLRRDIQDIRRNIKRMYDNPNISDGSKDSYRRDSINVVDDKRNEILGLQLALDRTRQRGVQITPIKDIPQRMYRALTKEETPLNPQDWLERKRTE